MADFKFGKKLDKSLSGNDEIVGKIKTIYENGLNQMRPQHNSWLLTMSYVAGDQYKYIDPQNYQIKDWHRIGGYEEREVYNKMRNMKNTYKARITQKKPYPIATPITTKEKDKRIASITSAVLDDQWEKQLVEEKINIIGENLAYFGATFWKVYWDNKLGEKVFPNVEQILNQVESSAYIDDNYRAILLRGLRAKKDIYEGDVSSEIISPFEFQVDSVSRRNMNEVQYCLYTRVYHKDILKMLYNLTDKDLPEENINSITLQEGSLSTGIGYIYSNNGYRQQTLKEHNLLIEYYERESMEYPNGRFIMIAGKKVIYSGELPYKNGRNGKRDLPFIRIVANEELGNFYGSTPIADLRALQRRYNAVRNRKVEALSRISIGQWMVAENSISKNTKLTNKPGAIITYKLGRPKPERFQEKVVLSPFSEEIDNLDRMFPQISGFTPYDQTNMNSNLRSATQMSMLFEQEDLRLGTTIINISNAVKLWAKMTIRLLQQFTVGTRFVKYQEQYDDNLEWDKNLINDNIRIKNVNALIKSPAQQTQMLSDLMGMGLMDQQNRYGYDNVLMILDSFGMGEFNAKIAIPNREDIEKAKRENSRGSKLKLIGVDKIVDNHSVHIREHSKYLKSEQFEELMLSIPHEQAIKVEKLLHEHLEQHQQILKIRALNMSMQQQQQQQAR